MVKENAMESKEIEEYVRRVLFKVEIVKSLLKDGKEIPAYEKLQGVYDNLAALIHYLQTENSENNRDTDIQKTGS